ETLMGRLTPLLPEQPANEFIQRFQAVMEGYFDPADRALGAVRKEIDQLGTVDAVGGRFSLRSFALALRANLDAAYTRENNLGEGVMIGDYRTAAAMRFRQVVLCGAYEGAFPAGPGTDAIIEDAAWGRLREEHPYIEDAQLRMQRAQEAAERAVASASDGLTWCCPLHEPGGTRQYYPSQPMVKAAERCDLTVSTGSSLRRHAAAGGWLRKSRSPLATVVSGAPTDSAEVRLRQAIGLRLEGGSWLGHPSGRAISMLRARRSSRFTEWDGNLETLGDPAWLDLQNRVSPTSLEHYGACGYRYFCRSLLRLNVVEEPGDLEVMDAGTRGVVIHGVLERFFAEMKARGR